MLETLMYFALVFYFMSPKWTRTNIVIEITLLLWAYSCLPLLQFLRICPEVPIEIGFALMVHSNGYPFHHILVCSFCYLGYENVKQLILVEVIWLAQMACQ